MHSYLVEPLSEPKVYLQVNSEGSVKTVQMRRLPKPSLVACVMRIKTKSTTIRKSYNEPISLHISVLLISKLNMQFAARFTRCWPCSYTTNVMQDQDKNS